MAKRGKNQARRNGGNGLPGWSWLLIGLLLGGLIFLAYPYLRSHWQNDRSGLPRPNPGAEAPATSDDEQPVVQEPVPDKPKYDFYTLLPEKEVVIPDAELAAQARAEAQTKVSAAPAPNAAPPTDAAPSPAPSATPSAAGSDSGRYLIQAGAFRGVDEAEALKAQIALTGEAARVETAQINGNTVYRVRMGPYPNASALAAAKQALAGHGIDGAQAIRVK